MYEWSEILQFSFQNLWTQFITFLPQLVVALALLIVGWIIGGLLGSLVRKLFIKFNLDDALDKAGADDLSKRAGYNFKPAKFAGELVKWFVILAFIVAAFDVLQLEEVTTFMREVVLNYLPKVFAAVLILFVGVIVANIVRNLTMGMVRVSGKQSELFGKVAYGLVIAFTIMAVLNQLQIADELIQVLFAGIVFALSLATGLAFGLGGKETAATYLRKVTGGSNAGSNNQSQHTHHN